VCLPEPCSISRTAQSGPGGVSRPRRHPAGLPDAVANLVGLDPTSSRDSLLDAIAETQPSALWRIAVDAVDEVAAAQKPQADHRAPLTELAALPQARLVVATQPLAAGLRERYLPGGLLSRLSDTAATKSTLDTDRYFDPAGRIRRRCARPERHEPHRPRAARGAKYRADPELCGRLARAIARRACCGHGLVDRELVLPASSADDPERCTSAGLPDDSSIVQSSGSVV
jgi:hypothetical protein